MSNASVRTIHKTIVLRALREKSAASRQRVKLARHILNLRALQLELARYDVSQLQKSAADNTNKAERLRYAALQVQYQIEKQAAGKGGLIGGGLRLVGGVLGGIGSRVGKFGNNVDDAFQAANNFLTKPRGTPGVPGLGSKVVKGVRDGVGYVAGQGYGVAKDALQGTRGMAGGAYDKAAPHLRKAVTAAGTGISAYAKKNPRQALTTAAVGGLAAVPALRLGGSAAREMASDVGNYVTGSTPTLGGFNNSTNVAGAAAAGFGQGALDSGRNMIDTARQYQQGAMRRAENVGRRGYHVADAMFGQLPQ